MRVPIREQLAILTFTAALIGLITISVPTWITSHDFVLRAQASQLSNIASLKAAQLTSNLELMQTGVGFVSTRVVIQQAVQRYNLYGERSQMSWELAKEDMRSALTGSASVGQNILMQSMLFPVHPNGPVGRRSLLNATSTTKNRSMLPYKCSEGTNKGKEAVLGMNYTLCGHGGYPPSLYPNLTYSTDGSTDASYNGVALNAQSALLLGPWLVGPEFYLVSITLPMIDVNTNDTIIAWLTFVMDWTLIAEVLYSLQDLGDSGVTLLLGPDNSTNLFPPESFFKTDTKHFDPNYNVRYVIPVNNTDTRHPNHTVNSPNLPFPASEYPAVVSAISNNMSTPGNSGSNVRTRNEAGKGVSVGFAVPNINLVDWVIVVEKAQSEVWRPIVSLRDILLATIFSTLGFIAFVSFPLAHFASRPIRSLREATERSVAPPSDFGRQSCESDLGNVGEDGMMADDELDGRDKVSRKQGFFHPVMFWRMKKQIVERSRSDEKRRREFRIPGKVKQHRHLVRDELSDLTMTFNEMSDELMAQYERLEERVKQRTAELELSKKAAEAANESKTLFIANISHELKTPLNGILGMTAVCMQEDDPMRLKRSLGIIYKSGDLLLHLLTDLLTFSKNQVGQQLSLEEKDFLLRDVSSQVLAIFEKQARENKIDLRVMWEGMPSASSENLNEKFDSGPAGTGKLRNMVLFGDVQRILQVLINLVSNSLKFTPPNGEVVLTIRFVNEQIPSESRRASPASRISRQSTQPSSMRHKSFDTAMPAPRMDTAIAINARDKYNGMRYPTYPDRTRSPLPGRSLLFEFEVKDTGPGIPEDIQDKIFEPFVQGDLGLSKKYAGTGLGLSICAQLASLLRGTIGVQSTVGVGSTFKMRIPLRHVRARTGSSASSGIDDLYENGFLPASSEDEATGPPKRRKKSSIDANNVAVEDPEPMPKDMPAAAGPQPRLVGLSRPFFSHTEPLDSPGSRAAAVEKITADAKRSSKRVRVLVADDNTVNQEVVCRMLKLVSFPFPFPFPISNLKIQF